MYMYFCMLESAVDMLQIIQKFFSLLFAVYSELNVHTVPR